MNRSGQRILCAEDNELWGDAVVRLFSSAGYYVEHVRDGLDAWHRLSDDLAFFHALVTDHVMPGLTGLELVEIAREANYGGRIVVHSSSLTDLELVRYRRFGVSAFVQKSTRPEDLIRALCG